MKNLFLTLALLTTAPAFADPVTLQIPTVATYSPSCEAVRVNQQSVTGFSDDGLYLYVQVQGYTVCGHSGVGSTASSTYWCDRVVLDLGGHLLSDTPLIAAHTAVAYTKCPHVNPAAPLVTNAAGYTAYSVDDTYNWTITTAVLESP